MARTPRASRESVAYQQEVVYREKPQIQREPLRVVRTRRSAIRLPHILCGLMVTAVSAALVCSQMMLTETTAQVAAQQEKLQQSQNEYVSLKARQDRQLNLSYVESYAQNKLGMVKMDSSATEYIEMDNPDRIEVTKNTNSVVSKLGSCAAAIKEYLQQIKE